MLNDLKKNNIEKGSRDLPISFVFLSEILMLNICSAFDHGKKLLIIYFDYLFISVSVFKIAIHDNCCYFFLLDSHIFYLPLYIFFISPLSLSFSLFLSLFLALSHTHTRTNTRLTDFVMRWLFACFRHDISSIMYMFQCLQHFIFEK